MESWMSHLYAVDPTAARAECDLRGTDLDPQDYGGIKELEDFDRVAMNMIYEGLLHVVNPDPSGMDMYQHMSHIKDPGLTMGEFRRALWPILNELMLHARSRTDDLGLERRGLISVRAGLAFQRAFEDVMPDIGIGYIIQTRNEKTSKPTSFLDKMGYYDGMHAILVDPMLATGGSMEDMVNAAAARGAERITVITAFTTVQGLVRIGLNPNVDLMITPPLEAGLASLGEDQNNYIKGTQLLYPFLGDAGDRYFGAVHEHVELGEPTVIGRPYSPAERSARAALVMKGLVLPPEPQPVEVK